MNREAMRNPQNVFREALSLDAHDRAALAQELLASLEELTEEEAESLWAEEAKRRLNGYHAGQAARVTAKEVAAKAKKLFQ